VASTPTRWPAGICSCSHNRRATQIKVLYFDRSGWCLWGKRLEAGRFVRNWLDRSNAEIDCAEADDGRH